MIDIRYSMVDISSIISMSMNKHPKTLGEEVTIDPLLSLLRTAVGTLSHEKIILVGITDTSLRNTMAVCN